jgi:hypothetical protein
LRITPFPFGAAQAGHRLPEELRHLLPQIRARWRAQGVSRPIFRRPFARSNKKGGFRPAGAGGSHTGKMNNTMQARCLLK